MEIIQSRDGTTIAVERIGAGPPLVLVHGGIDDHTRWRSVLPLLQHRFTVYAVDRRGRGASGDATPYGLEQEVDDILAVLDRADGPADLVGHSSGAICALDAALRTQRLRKLVLYEPPIAVGEHPGVVALAGRLQALLDAGEREAVVVAFLREAIGMTAEVIGRARESPGWSARVAAAHLLVREAEMVADYRFDATNFSSLDTPTLLLLGSATAPHHTAATAAVASALPNCRVVTLSGQGHVAMDTAPELFVREVLTFLTEPS